MPTIDVSAVGARQSRRRQPGPTSTAGTSSTRRDKGLAVEACREHGMSNRTTSRFSSDSTVLAQVGARRGFAILPRLAVEPLPDGLLALPLPIEALRSLVLIRRQNRRSAALRAVTSDLLADVRRADFPARAWLRA